MAKANVNRDFLEPEEATIIARRTLADFEFNNQNSLAGYLPSQEVPDIEYEIGSLDGTGAITAATWRAFNGATTSEHWEEQAAGGRGRLQPISRNFVLDEETRLRMRNNANDAIRRKSAELVERATRAIALEVNYQRARALVDAKIVLEGSGGLYAEVDFNRDPGLTHTTDFKFDQPDSDPLEQIAGWVEYYEDTNGQRPEEMMMTSKILSHIRRHPVVINEAIGSKDTTRRVATAAELDALIDLYNLPKIELIGTQKVRRNILDPKDDNYGGTKDEYLLPQDSIIFNAGKSDPADPDGNIYGRTFWGATLSGDTENFNFSGAGLDVPGVVAAVIEHGWPSAMEIIADAIALPVVFQPNLTMKVQVI